MPYADPLKQYAANYAAQKARRLARKADLVTALGGCCVDCGYGTCIAALDLHHRDGASKDFAIGGFGGSLARLRLEVAKCDLVCANCHRVRHDAERSGAPAHPVVAHRRRLKARAVVLMGSHCEGCGRIGPPAIFDFHHRDTATKSFGIGEDGNTRSWDRIVAELANCVLLCANCHREVHAGARQLGAHLGEHAIPYAA